MNNQTTDGLDEVRRMMREVRFASLATLDAATGCPFASLVNLAQSGGGAPLILISDLARHTANLRANPCASVLLADPAAPGSDPLNNARVTLTGTFHQLTAPPDVAGAEACFLDVHPAAAQYAAFADFSWWTMQVEAAHLVAGFGRIRTYSASQLKTT